MADRSEKAKIITNIRGELNGAAWNSLMMMGRSLTVSNSTEIATD
jgi:hypothetical protein